MVQRYAECMLSVKSLDQKVHKPTFKGPFWFSFKVLDIDKLIFSNIYCVFVWRCAGTF